MKYRVSISCHQGLVRENMEDYAYPECGFSGILEPVSSVAVLDGLGGHPGGEVASETAAQFVKEVVDEETFKDAMKRASLAVADAFPGSATTITLGILKDDGVDVYWIGDSPAFAVYNDGSCRMITTPHADPETGRITSVLGGRRPGEFFYDHVFVPVSDVKAVILASDGLTAHLNEDEIGSIYLSGGDLIKEVLSRGAIDNVTVAIIEPVK